MKQSLVSTKILLPFIVVQLIATHLMQGQDKSNLAKEVEAQRNIWNKALVHDTAAFFNKRPNALLVNTIQQVKPGKALDIGMGQGRNSIFLAEQGWNVTGIDVADEAVNVALAQAKEKKLNLTAKLEPMQTFDFGIRQWDLIVHVYEGCLNGDSSKFEKIVKALKPGGLLVFEFFHQEAGVKMGSPEFGCTAANTKQLVEESKKFNLLLYTEEEDVADFTLKKWKLIKLVAQRK